MILVLEIPETDLHLIPEAYITYSTMSNAEAQVSHQIAQACAISAVSRKVSKAARSGQLKTSMYIAKEFSEAILKDLNSKGYTATYQFDKLTITW